VRTRVVTYEELPLTPENENLLRSRRNIRARDRRTSSATVDDVVSISSSLCALTI
jgi:hypothetical protein